MLIPSPFYPNYGNPKPPLPGAQQARFIWLIHLAVVYSALICISTALTTPNQRQGHKIVCDQMCVPGRSWTEAGSQPFWSLLPRACKNKTKQSNTHTHIYQKTSLKCPLFIPMGKMHWSKAMDVQTLRWPYLWQSSSGLTSYPLCSCPRQMT